MRNKKRGKFDRDTACKVARTTVILTCDIIVAVFAIMAYIMIYDTNVAVREDVSIDSYYSSTGDSEYEVLDATIYHEYILCDNGEIYYYDAPGTWYDTRGQLIYNIGERVIAVVSADSIIAILSGGK